MQRPALGPAVGLVAITRDHGELPELIRQLHAAGVRRGAVTVLGRPDAASARELAIHGDPPPARRPQAPHVAAMLHAPGHQHEVSGATLGVLLGLTGGIALLALPEVGTVALLGGAAAVAAAEAAIGLAGGTFGGVLGAALDFAVVTRHEARYRQALAEDRWVVVVRGAAEELRRAREVLERFGPLHLDAI